MIKRRLEKEIKSSLSHGKSIFLLGPRQTGKSTLSLELEPTLKYNLADRSVFMDFAKDPGHLLSEIQLKTGNRKCLILLDEVQLLPSLLNTVQSIIDQNKKIQFVLTGSSARKLKRGQANLLPGRVHVYNLSPIISSELNYEMDTLKALTVGSLPEVTNENNAIMIKKLLKSYTLTYLDEEIKAEALTKNIEGFTRFLFQLAADSTKYLDLTKISRNTAVPRQTVQRYFQILEDTLIVNSCPSFAKSVKRRLVQHPRFFFFDNGVLNALLNSFSLSEDRKGFLFENLFYNQLHSSLACTNYDYRISSYRTDAGAEVDFILEIENEIYAIEAKTGGFSEKNLKGFESFQSFIGKNKKFHRIVVTPDGKPKINETAKFLPWQDFLKDLNI